LATTSNVKRQPVNSGRIGRKGNQGMRYKVTKRRKRKEGVEWGSGAHIDREGGIYLNICAGARIPSYTEFRK